MEREKFEESFREAFQKAEVNPSENIWTNIELDLERLESGKMKRSILFYKMVAAASIVAALTMGGVGYYLLSTDASPVDNIALHTNPQNSTSVSPTDEKIVDENVSKNNADQNLREDKSLSQSETISQSTSDENSIHTNSADNVESKTLSQKILNDDTNRSGNRQLVTPPVDVTNQSAAYSSTGNQMNQEFQNRKLPALVRKRKFELVFPKTEPDKFDILLAQQEWEEKRRKKSADEKIWTSVGFSAGSFNGASSGSNLGALNASIADMSNSGFQSYSMSNTLNNEASASGVAYSVGVNVGTRLSKRWVLQGGLNYMTQNSNYTSDALITTDYMNYSVANSAEITKLSGSNKDARIVNTSPYNVNNSLQFLSVPLQAGYVLVNRAFAIQLNGGVSTDLFLQNTITPENGSLDKVSNGRGEDSPYRPVNFSGLAGTEFSYRFADRYRLALTPGVRYPFSSIYKSETGLEVNPVTFDVGLRFRYIFQ